jgi:WD40 repeat protein
VVSKQRFHLNSRDNLINLAIANDIDPDSEYLASGGNDNQLLVWSLRKNEPVQTYTEHNAAVV